MTRLIAAERAYAWRMAAMILLNEVNKRQHARALSNEPPKAEAEEKWIVEHIVPQLRRRADLIEARVLKR